MGSQPIELTANNGEHLGGTYRRSAEFGELATAMVAVQAELKNPKKDQTADIPTKSGGKYSYSYADLAGVLDSCRETMTKHGLAIFQPVAVERNAVTVSTLLAHKSGQWICSDLTLASNDATPQGIGSAITYARRYGLTAMVGIAAEDDDGAGASRGNQKQDRKPAPRATVGDYGPPPAPFYATDDDLPSVLGGAAPKPPAPVPADRKPWTKMSEMIACFAKMKDTLNASGGSDAIYYGELDLCGVKHANAFKSAEVALKCYRALEARLGQLQGGGTEVAV